MLGECGADVCIGYRSRQRDAEAMVARLSNLGVRALAHGSDLSIADGAEALFSKAVASLGGVDIVVHSAGIWPSEDVAVQEMSDERWHDTMRQNLDAMFFVSRAAARVLGPGGRIVHVASTAGQRGEAYHADYAATKGAMIAFAKSQAVELAPRGVTVNCVAPGWVNTEMCEAAFREGGLARIAATIPTRRVAEPREVAWAVLMLCSPLALQMSGSTISVNGGAVLA
jgi:3-oxoacyl-[acyl-carrier protein] reductase